MKTINLDELISANLRYEIESCGKKKKDIAEAMGVSCATISEYCHARSQPTLANLSRLCTVIGASADEILGIKKF